MKIFSWIMRILLWTIFVVSLFLSCIAIPDLAGGRTSLVRIGWQEWLLINVVFSISIIGFIYLLLRVMRGRWLEKINQKQKMILAIFIPIIFFILTLSILGSIYKDAFRLTKTGGAWIIYAIFCLIFEYKLFADKK